MASSGTFNFILPNSGIITEAFDRIKRPPPTLGRHEMLSARVSLNLELTSLENEGWPLWKTISGTIPLVAGEATYTLPTNLVTIEDMFYTTVNGLGSGVNSDRTMLPMTQEEYAQLTNKLQGGIPTRWWLQMLTPTPQVTIWQVPLTGQAAPNFQIGWMGLQQMQDANITSGETPDVPRRCYDALCARMALRLAEKFGPDGQAGLVMMQAKKLLADEASWNLGRRDNEKGSASYRPNLAPYARLRR